jgi:teichuronic acid exporter
MSEERPPSEQLPAASDAGDLAALPADRSVAAAEAVIAAPAFHMDRVLVRGVAWTAGAKWVSQLSSWTATIVVAKILGPANYGIVGMAAVVLALIAIVNEFGVTTAIVTFRTMPEEDLQRLNSIALAIGFGCFLLGAALAVPVSAYFRAPALVAVMLVESTGFILSGLQSVPIGRLQRDLAFRRLAVIEVVRSVVASVTALALAYYGAGYWALILCELVAISTHSSLLIIARPTAFRWRDFGRVRKAVVFSGRTLVGNLAWYSYSNSDFVVAGRMLGAAGLGIYGFAWQLTSLPVEKVTALVGRVTPAVLSANQDDRDRLRRYLHRITEGIALLTIPATAGIALVAICRACRD